MHINALNRICFVLGFLLVITGCSPVYDKSYKYFPPESPAGNRCLNTCIGIKQSCRANKDREVSDCRVRASTEYATCMALRNYEFPGGRQDNRRCVTNCYCNRDYCSPPDYSSCEELYAECYKNCGGQVSVTEKCVRFCR